MMNINIIPPREGYLRAGPRADRRARRQADLRRGQDRRARSPPAARPQRFGVTPDMITLAKASCGGYPGGAIGMTEELAAIVADGTVKQYGTFNGNPLVMAAAEATLTEVLTDDVYEQLEATNKRPARRLPGDHRRPRPARLHRGPRRQGLRHLLAGAAVRVPRLPDQGRRRALDAGLALPHEPRHLHDPGRRGGVDALDRPLRRGPADATSTPSRPSPATSRAERPEEGLGGERLGDVDRAPEVVALGHVDAVLAQHLARSRRPGRTRRSSSCRGRGRSGRSPGR